MVSWECALRWVWEEAQAVQNTTLPTHTTEPWLWRSAGSSLPPNTSPDVQTFWCPTTFFPLERFSGQVWKTKPLETFLCIRLVGMELLTKDADVDFCLQRMVYRTKHFKRNGSTPPPHKKIYLNALMHTGERILPNVYTVLYTLKVNRDRRYQAFPWFFSLDFSKNSIKHSIWPANSK